MAYPLGCSAIRYVAFTRSNSSTTDCAGGGVSNVTPMADGISPFSRLLASSNLQSEKR